MWGVSKREMVASYLTKKNSREMVRIHKETI